ncbi:hypothetical protein [Brevibacillus daliensis]|uniref:hypothetical protein n=1 Tax=Brevibacillus daliensis TaxID=2892995 RepID=UPI001E4B3B20|nr:hypothetical protein [Brevibacillus daliensis]
MRTDGNKKTMRFWIFSGIVAIAASQLPLILKNRKQDVQEKQQQQKRPWWLRLLIWTFIAFAIWGVFRLIDFFT